MFLQFLECFIVFIDFFVRIRCDTNIFNVLYLFILIAENRYKHEGIMVDGEPVLFEILDTCPKVSLRRVLYTSIRYRFTDARPKTKNVKFLTRYWIWLLFACWMLFLIIRSGFLLFLLLLLIKVK